MVFFTLFSHDVASGCEVYLQAPQAFVDDFVCEAAKAKGAVETDTALDMNVCLSGAHFQRLLGYRNLFRQTREEETLSQFPAFAVNLEQTSGFHGAGSHIAPALLTRSNLVVVKADGGPAPPCETDEGEPANIRLPAAGVRVVLPLEHFAIMSFPHFLRSHLSLGPVLSLELVLVAG